MSDPDGSERGGPRRIGVGPADLDAVVWGLVGGLSFLVLLSGYELVTGWRAGWFLKLGVAAVVTVAATVASGLIASRFRERQRENERA